jgi:excisionase family DNA binding protein
MEHLMTSEEVAEILHVDPVTIRRLVNRNELAAYRIGSDYRIAPSDLEEYLQRQRIPARTNDPSNPSANIPIDQFMQALRFFLQGKQTTPSQVGDRFDRFNEQARSSLTFAQEEAQRYQHNYVGTEHLLLGIIHDERSTATQILNELGVDSGRVRQGIEHIIGRGDRIVLGEIGLTPRAKKAIELAVDEARRLNHHYIGTEHLLLGLVREGEGIAAGVLEQQGVNLEKVRVETARATGVDGNDTSSE